MDWFASALPIKPICRFLLNRYLGEILLEKVNLEQLSVDVLNGTGSISDVNLDVQHINQSLRKNSTPFELVDGFIGYISVRIPFSKLLQESCTIEITGLELTLQPKPCRSTDLVSSMIESVIGSMTTSMDLARSFVEEQTNGGGPSDVDQQFQGIDALAQIIQIILSRMKINFNDTIVRLEHFPSTNQDTGVALEVRIDRIEFVDEVVDVTPSSSDEPITEQPQSSAAFVQSPVQDISKIVKLQGVRFYTDIFTKPEGALCKSVVFRRKNIESSHVEVLTEAGCSAESSVYKSCYSGGTRSTIMNGEFTSSTTSSNGFEPNSLPSKPIQIAQFSSDELRLRVRLKNSTMTVDGFKHDEVDIELFLGALSVFLTPTQIYLIAEIAKNLLSNGDSCGVVNELASKGGKPMLDEDFAKVEMELRRKIEETRLPTSCFKPESVQAGNWSGDDKFYHSSKTPWKTKSEHDLDEFTSIPMYVDENGPDLLQTAQNSNRNRLHSTSNDIWNGTGGRKISACEKPETSRCKIYLTNLFFVLTHDDPLTTSTTMNGETLTASLINAAEKFFEAAERLSLSSGSSLKDVRKYCDDAYPKDHLRFIACPLVVEYTQNKQDNMQICLTSRKAELLECLFDESSSNGTQFRSPTRVEILNFDENDEEHDHPDLHIRFGTEDKQNYVCTIELNKCSIEIDISLVDRLNNLLFCQPSFKLARPLQNKYLFEVPKADLSLRDDWFEPLDDRPSAAFACAVEVFCSCFTINFRIPIPDLRPCQAVDRSPWWIQRVRDDVLRLKLEKTTFKTNFCENIAKLGNFLVEFSKGTVYFVEADKQQPTKLLHVYEDNQQTCGFEFKWDFVNRSLFDDRLQECSSTTRSNESIVNSLERNCFKISSNLDGPFSKKHVVHEDEQLTIVGSRSEMKEFRGKCLKNCETGIHLRLPGCRLFLPDKQFYELLYNRLCNDLAFWTPSSPGFQNCSQTAGGNDPYNVWVTGLGLDQDHFAPCKSGRKAEDSDSDSESTLKSSMFGGNSLGSKRKGPHKFSCLLQCGSMDLMMFLADKNTSSSAKLRFTIRNGELFFVYGYESDENTSYFYVTSETASLKHAPQNLNLVVVDDVVTDVESKEFAKNQDWTNTAEPTPPNLALKTDKDDNFSVAIRLVLHPKENVKEFLITLGIRNSTLHYRTIPADQFWLTQLISFFNVVDYPVLGFEPPKVINEIHVHSWNLVVQYKPEKLPYALRLYVDSLDVSTNLVQESSMFRFHIILEDSSLFVTDKAINRIDLAYNLSMRDYVCLMKMGFFELILTNFEPPNDDDERQRPLQELHVHNDSLEIRTCPDSFAILTSILKYLAIGGDVKSTETNENVEFYNEEILKNPNTNSNNEFVDSTEERLKDLMASAMEEAVLPPPKAPPRSKNDRTKSKASTSSRKSSSGVVRDEEFLILDEVTGTGIRSKSGEPRIRTLSSEPLNIVDNHVAPPLRRTDPLTSLPAGYPLPLLQYFVRDFTIVWHLYGGRDFGEITEQKPYSRMAEAQHTPKLRQRFNEAKRTVFTCGGANRDHSVHAELYLNKMCLLYELYPPGNAQAARQILTVQDVEIRDHLFASSINKLLYRYTTEQKPKQTYLPMFCVKMLHFVPDSGEIQGDGECCLKISVLPLRLNIDQDTLLFLSDFGKDFAQFTSSVPVVGVKRPSSSSSLPGVKLNQTIFEEESSSNVKLNSATTNGTVFETPPPLNDSLFDDLQSQPISNGINLDIFDDAPSTTTTDDDVPMAKIGRRSRTTSNCSVKSDAEFKQTSVSGSVNEGGYYFKSFVFSPAVELKLDYHGKRLQLEQGALPGLLLGLSQLHATELKLKELHYRHGLLGFEKVMSYAINEWLNDIRRNQMYNIVGGVGPVHTLVQVSQGIVDLFWLPVDQYRRDGHIVKGFQRGAQSFGVSTASAALELSQRLVGTLQGVAEFAFDIVNPEYPPKSNGDLLQGLLQPYDFREGVHMACATFRRGFTETAEAITLATQEEKARGRWAIRGVLRQATPTILRPLVVASQATTHILGGLRNQLRPDSWREEQDKWKNE